MNLRVEWSTRALKDLEKLTRRDARRALRAVEAFAASGVGDLRKLRGPLEGFWRLRVGAIRVLLSLEEQGVLRIDRIADRKDVYG